MGSAIGVVDEPPIGGSCPLSRASGGSRRLGAERLRRRRKESQGPSPTREAENPAPRNVPLGGVQALTLLQGRQGMVKLTLPGGSIRRLADDSGTDRGYNFP